MWYKIHLTFHNHGKAMGNHWLLPGGNLTTNWLYFMWILVHTGVWTIMLNIEENAFHFIIILRFLFMWTHLSLFVKHFHFHSVSRCCYQPGVRKIQVQSVYIFFTNHIVFAVIYWLTGTPYAQLLSGWFANLAVRMLLYEHWQRPELLDKKHIKYRTCATSCVYKLIHTLYLTYS